MENTFTYKWEVNFGPRYGNGDTAIHTYSGSLHLLPRVRGKSQRQEHLLLLLLYTELYMSPSMCND